MQYRSDIDGLRAVAVLAVVAFHYGLGPLTGGFVGVDIFFVISGYLITQIIVDSVEAENFSFSRFYARRIRRLFPALFTTLMVSTVAAAFLFSPIQMERFAQSLIGATLSFSNVLFWSEHGYFDVASELKPLLHTWSLSVEEQFYLVWPFCLVAIMRLPSKYRPGLVAIITLASFVSNLASTNSPSTMFYLSPFRAFEFTLGAGLVWSNHIPAPRAIAREIAFASGMALIAFAIFAFTRTTLFPSYNALIPALGTVLAIYGGTAKWTPLVIRNRVAVWIGRISYSLYLVHWPLLVFWQYYREDELPRHERWVLFVLALCFAGLMFRFIEQPYRRARVPSGPGRSLPFYPVAAILALCMVLGGLHIVLTHGWTWRLGERGQRLAEIATDKAKAELVAYGGDGCDPMGCTTQGKRKPDLIVIGDSHSRQYYAGFRAVLPNLNVQFFEFSSCQFFSPTYTRDFHDFDDPVMYDQGCRSTRKAAFEAIRNARVPVVIGEYWGNFAMVSEIDGSEKTLSSTEEYMKFAAEQIDLLRSDLDIGKIFVFGSVPTTDGANSPLDCMGRTALTMRSCATVPQSNPIIAARAAINTMLRTELGADVVFLDPFPALCDGDTCKMIEDDMPVYSDQTHLSAWGAARVIAAIAPALTLN